MDDASCRGCGGPTEPAFVAHTAAFLAELRGETAETLARATTDNFFTLFARARRPLRTRGGE